tara:strand:+ start:20038 stop:21060 length:1023 start_codon:yes stop_codon:yes gene_type:complete
MPRIGQNPLKWIGINKRPEKITIVTIVYIPELAGFWENSLDVLKLFINSLHENTTQPFDLMVLDNGSCDEVKEYILECQNNNKIQFLTFSEYNLRKLGGMNYLFNTAPGEIISFVDSDVYFLKGWLDATLEILKVFPLSGMVSAIPTIDKSMENYESTFNGIKKEKDIIKRQSDNLIPEEYVIAHQLSLGKEKTAYMRNINNRIDTKIIRDNVSAYICAQDFQFTTTRDVIKKVLPLDVRHKREYYDPIYSPVFESKVNELGFWRLSTEKYLIHHIGNSFESLDDELLLLKHNSNNNKITLNKKNEGKKYSIFKRILLNQYVRKVLKFFYSKLYNLLYNN